MIDGTSDHAADSQGDHAPERIRAGAWVQIAEGMQAEQGQSNDAKSNMPVQRTIQLAYRSFARTTIEAIPYRSKEHKEGTGDSKTIACNAIGRLIATKANIPDENRNPYSNQHNDGGNANQA